MADLAWHKTPEFIINYFSGLTWRIKTEDKTVYPTFDDGPIPILTEEILSILKDLDAKATFFCVGENIAKHPRIFEKVVKDGHAVGNHTYNHLKAWRNSEEYYLQNVKKTDKLIEEILSQKCQLFRPPYGQLRPGITKALLRDSKEIIMWDLLSKDYDKGLNKEKALKQCTKNSGPGSIIVFHDNLKARDNVLDLLPKYINFLKKEGFSFKTL